MLEIVKDIKVTFPDILGTVGEYINLLKICLIRINLFISHSGGTIGLFTGLSLISVVEIFYWIYRYVIILIVNASSANNFPNF